MTVVFDLDGVIIDSGEVVRTAYRLAGVRPPAEILRYEGRPWLERQVGPDRVAEVRRRKNSWYLKLVGDVDRELKTLPAYDVAQTLRAQGRNVVLMTGAPPGTIGALQHRLRPWPFTAALDGVRTPRKMDILRDWNDEGGVYVDDQTRLVSVPDRWRFIHYTGQDAQWLYRRIGQMMERMNDL